MPLQHESRSSRNQQEVKKGLDEKELQRQKALAHNKQASAPILVDLAHAGFTLDWVSDLYIDRLNYKGALPILIKWLPLTKNLDVKEDIVRALSVPWAKPMAAQVLVEEYRQLRNESNTGIKWAIANALSVVADDSVFPDIVEFIQDSSNGKSREMLAVALGNMKDPYAIDILITLLNDEEVAGHAIIGLGKLKAKEAIQVIEPFRSHPKTWIRNQAKRALARIEKSSK